MCMSTGRAATRLAALAWLAGVVLGPSVSAEELWPIGQRFNVSLGAFVVDTDTRIRVDGSGGEHGTQVDLDDTFGFDSQNRFRVDGYWRFFERHKLRFLYFSSSVGGSSQITEQIDFGDSTFPIDASVRGDLQIEIFEVAYEYGFVRRDNFEIAGTLGLHNLSITTELNGTASSSTGGGGIDVREEAKGEGPLPVVGLRGIWAFSDRFYADAQAQFFAASIDEYDGNLSDYKISVVWHPFRNVGVGIGYNAFTTKLDVDASSFKGTLRFEYAGPLVFVSAAF